MRTRIPWQSYNRPVAEFIAKDKDWWRGSYRNPYLDEGNNAGKENDEGFGQCIWLNLALGSNGGEPDLSKFPLEYHVDYVRVYQFE